MNTLNKNAKSRKVELIMGVGIDSTPVHVLLKRVKKYIKNKKTFFIVTPNPEIVLMSRRDAPLLQSLNSADISVPDGIGLIFAAKILNLNLKHRIPGRIFMEKLFSLANSNKLKVYLLGGSHAVISSSLKKLKNEYPSLVASGSVGPKLGQNGKPISQGELEIQTSVISDINVFKPHILIIGFGAPKQEKWFALHREQLPVLGAMVVGGSLDVFSGHKNATPDLLSNRGLEWVWRLIHEPSRISRIANAVVVFPLFVFWEKLRQLVR